MCRVFFIVVVSFMEGERENENFFEFVLDLERCDGGGRDEPDFLDMGLVW